jgi:hypothetical protein
MKLAAFYSVYPLVLIFQVSGKVKAEFDEWVIAVMHVAF